MSSPQLAPPSAPATGAPAPVPGLRRSRRPSRLFSEFEMQVLRLAHAGTPPEEIAARLGVSPRSVRDAERRSRHRLGGNSLSGVLELLAS